MVMNGEMASIADAMMYNVWCLLTMDYWPLEKPGGLRKLIIVLSSKTTLDIAKIPHRDTTHVRNESIYL